jgi:hypothetical protein
MALGTWSVSPTTKRRDNTQVYEWWDGTLTWSAFGDISPVGGADIKGVLAAALAPTGPLKSLLVWSSAGSGYIYDYIEATGKLMVLQVPPSGSLTTAAPLQQIGSGANSMSGVFQDTIRFRAQYVRNF